MDGLSAAGEAAPVKSSHDASDRAIAEAIAATAFGEALELCAQRYAARLGRLCMAMVGSQAEAEDLVQETLLAAHDAFPSFRSGSVRAFLYTIARRKCARHLEVNARRSARLLLIETHAQSYAAEQLAADRQRAHRARSALERLRPSEREVLLLRYLSELSYPELAEVTGIEESAVRKRVSRALAKLRDVLSTEEEQ